MKIKNYTIEQLTDAVKESFSIRQVLTKLGLAPKGGNYSTFNRLIKKYNIDTSHFTGKFYNKGRKLPPRAYPLQDILVKGRHTQSHKLKLRLISSGILENCCSICKLYEWMGKPIPIELDHIDGDNLNNELSNLRILCPNCHAQTPNYRGKNIGKKS